MNWSHPPYWIQSFKSNTGARERAKKFIRKKTYPQAHWYTFSTALRFRSTVPWKSTHSLFSCEGKTNTSIWLRVQHEGETPVALRCFQYTIKVMSSTYIHVHLRGNYFQLKTGGELCTKKRKEKHKKKGKKKERFRLLKKLDNTPRVQIIFYVDGTTTIECR